MGIAGALICRPQESATIQYMPGTAIIVSSAGLNSTQLGKVAVDKIASGIISNMKDTHAPCDASIMGCCEPICAHCIGPVTFAPPCASTFERHLSCFLHHACQLSVNLGLSGAWWQRTCTRLPPKQAPVQFPKCIMLIDVAACRSAPTYASQAALLAWVCSRSCLAGPSSAPCEAKKPPEPCSCFHAAPVRCAFFGCSLTGWGRTRPHASVPAACAGERSCDCLLPRTPALHSLPLCTSQAAGIPCWLTVCS